MEICKGDVVEFRMVAAQKDDGLLYGQLLADGDLEGSFVDGFCVSADAVVANHGQYVPAIKEPTGLGALVETGNGFVWVKFNSVVPERWTNGSLNESWSDLMDPKQYGGIVAVRSDGVDV